MTPDFTMAQDQEERHQHAAAVDSGNGRLGGWARWLPLLFFQFYLNLSILLFAFGPWIWPISNSRPLYVFIALAHLALFLGYATAIRYQPRPYVGSFSSRRLLWLSVLATLALFPPTIFALTGGTLDIAGALADPSEAYYRYQELEAGGGSIALVYMRVAVAPLLVLLMPLLVQSWRQSPVALRVLGLVAIGSNLMLYLATGRNKGFVDLVLLLPWMLAIYVLVHGVKLRVGRVALAIAAGGALMFFVSNFYARNTSGRLGPTGSLLVMPLLSGIEADLDNPMLRDRPPLVQIGVMGLTFSQTHGYGALALALQKPWTPTWGFGHSYFLQTISERVTGNQTARARSFPGKLQAEDGWGLTEYWHTTYTWLASDLSFPGTLLAVFLIGRLLALTWIDAVGGRNPYALGLFVLVITMLYYFPTNNIVLGFPESLVGFWSLMGLWLFTRGYVAAPESEQDAAARRWGAPVASPSGSA